MIHRVGMKTESFQNNQTILFIRKEDKKRMIICETEDPAGIMSNHHMIDSTMRLTEYILQKKNKETPTKSKINGIQQKKVVTTRKTRKKIEWFQIPIHKKC